MTDRITFQMAIDRLTDTMPATGPDRRAAFFKYTILKVVEDHKKFCRINHPDGDCECSMHNLYEIAKQAGVKFEEDEFQLFM